MLPDVLELAKVLIARPSVTPEDAGCQALLGQHLSALDFRLEPLPFGEVQNLWATHGSGSPVFVFAGHTDVVPPGPLDAWTYPPFTPTTNDGYLYGRGAVDMKSSLAAMIRASAEFLQHHPKHPGTLAFLITSDEEGPARLGTRKVIECLKKRGQTIDWCVIGEPSSSVTLGDTLKVGRRGSLNGTLHVYGKQGHIAYPEKAENPIPLGLPVLDALSAMHWDPPAPDAPATKASNAFETSPLLHSFPATAFQLSSVYTTTRVRNVIPAALVAEFNFRYSPRVTAARLKARVVEMLAKHHGVPVPATHPPHTQKTAVKSKLPPLPPLPKAKWYYRLEWQLSGKPFLSKEGRLIEACQRAIAVQFPEATRSSDQPFPALSTSGGTSDGRFIAELAGELVELGPPNARIHAVDERIALDVLSPLACLYRDVLLDLFPVV